MVGIAGRCCAETAYGADTEGESSALGLVPAAQLTSGYSLQLCSWWICVSVCSVCPSGVSLHSVFLKIPLSSFLFPMCMVCNIKMILIFASWGLLFHFYILYS